MFEEIGKAFVAQGFAAILLFILGLYHFREKAAGDAREAALIKRGDEEAQKRIQDAKDYAEHSRKLQADIMIAVGKLSDVQEAKELTRELLEAIANFAGPPQALVSTRRHPKFRGRDDDSE